MYKEFMSMLGCDPNFSRHLLEYKTENSFFLAIMALSDAKTMNKL